MAKLFVLVTLVAMVLMAEGFMLGNKNLNLNKFFNRRDPFPEPKTPPPSTGNVVEGWITQRLDNFDPQNEETWQQRYLMNGEHFLEDGCIFLFLSGEWAVTEYRLENSLMEQMSQEFSCYMFYLEHRFYGESRPTLWVVNWMTVWTARLYRTVSKNLYRNATEESLSFLTVEQALADTAHFITHIKSEAVTPGARNSPVIVIGGQYSGSLAAWTRQQYPHLVAAAWASSAPVLAVYDQFQYKELSGAVYRHVGGNDCYERIERGFAQVEEMVAAGNNAEVSELFHLCNVFDDELDSQVFFSLISEAFSLIAQFDEWVSINSSG